VSVCEGPSRRVRHSPFVDSLTPACTSLGSPLPPGEGHKAAKERLAQADACGVTKVIGVSKLKSNYKPFEAKRRLCASFDLFLSDDRILPLLPPLLGKQFFKKKKQPIPVSLGGPRSDWAAEVKRATASTSLVLGGGACSAVRCARSTQKAGEVAANVMAAAAGVVHYVPRGWANVRSMYLKTSASVALPLYTCLPTQAEAEQPGQAEKKAAKKEAKKAQGAAKAQAKAAGGDAAAAAAAPPALKAAEVAPTAGVKRKAADASKAKVAPAAAPSGRAETLGAKAAAAAGAPGKRVKR
jgi:hypothetical protein